MSQTATRKQKAPMPGAARPRVVSVEDDEDLRSVLRGWLTPYYDLILLPHGEELVEEIELLQPDLVMLDIGLPGPDGLHLCHRLRTQSRLDRVPILIYSGRQDDEAFLDSLQAGASAFLLKPAEKEDLLARIEELLSR